MQFVYRFVSCPLLLVTALGCGGDSKTSEPKPPVGRDAAADTDSSVEPKDSSVEPKDAAPACTDDPETPGNDCADAVGCRAADRCGLDTQSCCVPGLNVMAVACVEGLTCTDSGRATCDGPEDCGGNACCVDIVAGTASCSTELACPSGFQLCHDDDACSDGDTCARGMTFTWWGLCS